MRTRPTLTIGVALSAVLLLAACGTNGGDGNGGGGNAQPSYSEEQFDGAVDEFSGDLTSVGSKAQADAGVGAITDVNSPIFAFGRGSIFVRDGLGIQLAPLAAEDLPRGVWDWTGSEWTLTDPSATNLVLRWSFDDGAGVGHDAELVIDWTATTEARDATGATYEVPTETGVTLTLDGAVTAADFTLTFAWYECSGDTVLEPTHAMIDGQAGIDATLTLNEVRFDVTSDTISSSGEVIVAADGDKAGFDWDVSATGTITRESCFFEDFDVASGSVDVSLFSEPAGETRSTFGFGFDFDNVVLDADTEAVQSVDLSGGYVTIDDATAVTFAGTLDDENGNGIWGDNVTVTFTGEASKSLETILEEQMASATGLVRLLSLVR